MKMEEDIKEKLLRYRQEIDTIDREIVRLVLRRAEMALQIGASKREYNLPIYRPDREKEIYSRIAAQAQQLYGHHAPLSSENLQQIYREIISSCISAEGGLTVAYLGPKASFSHLALQRHFGRSVEARPVETIPTIFRLLEAGRQENFGVVPVDNTTEGAIGITLDSFLQSELQIYAEYYLRVSHCLLAGEKVAPKDIRRLYTIKVAREQCREWLNSNMNVMNIEVIEVTSTAQAAKQIAQQRDAAQQCDSAAIASAFAAETYNLEIIARNIQDQPNNVTRFLVIGRSQCPPSGDDKTSIAFALVDCPGSLARLLHIFEEQKINLTRIESRRHRRSYGEYIFFVDFLGHRQDDVIKEVLQEVKKRSSFLKILGSYPRMEIPR